MVVPGHDQLDVGDIINLHLHGSPKSGEFKITKVTLHPSQGLSRGFEEYECEWRSKPSDAWVRYGIIDSIDESYKWIKLSSAPVTQRVIDYPNGCVCKRCNSRNKWAIPNQKDGTSYVCYECR